MCPAAGIGARVRRSPLVAAFMAGSVFALGLGGWQLRRHEERNADWREAQAVAGAATGGAALLTPGGAWRTVSLDGEFVGAPILLAGRLRGESRGYGQVQAFRHAGGTVLVDRGWIAGTEALAGGPARLEGRVEVLRGEAGVAELPARLPGAATLPAGSTAAAAGRLGTGGGVVVVVDPPPLHYDTTSRNYAIQWLGIAVAGIAVGIGVARKG